MKPEERYQHYYNEGYNAGSAKGYKQGYEDAINRTCEYLEEYTPQKFEDVQNYVENFRKAMKGGEE